MSGLVGKRVLADVPGLGEMQPSGEFLFGPVPWPPAELPSCNPFAGVATRAGVVRFSAAI